MQEGRKEEGSERQKESENYRSMCTLSFVAQGNVSKKWPSLLLLVSEAALVFFELDN